MYKSKFCIWLHLPFNYSNRPKIKKPPEFPSEFMIPQKSQQFLVALPMDPCNAHKCLFQAAVVTLSHSLSGPTTSVLALDSVESPSRTAQLGRKALPGWTDRAASTGRCFTKFQTSSGTVILSLVAWPQAGGLVGLSPACLWRGWDCQAGPLFGSSFAISPTLLPSTAPPHVRMSYLRGIWGDVRLMIILTIIKHTLNCQNIF